MAFRASLIATPGVTRTTRACRVGAISSDPRPEISSTDHWTTQLFCHQSIGDQPTTIHAAPLGTARVINTLLRVVHGGSSGWGSLPMGQPPTGDPEINDDPYPTENKDPKRRRIVFAGGDVAHARVSRDVFLNPTPSRRARKNPKNVDCKDEWIWKDEVTLVRVHKTPRRRMFCSQRG